MALGALSGAVVEAGSSTMKVLLRTKELKRKPPSHWMRERFAFGVAISGFGLL